MFFIMAHQLEITTEILSFLNATNVLIWQFLLFVIVVVSSCLMLLAFFCFLSMVGVNVYYLLLLSCIDLVTIM